MNHPRFEFMRHDVTFPLYVEVDEIYNLACPASPIHYQFDPVNYQELGLSGDFIDIIQIFFKEVSVSTVFKICYAKENLLRGKL